jgi:hypothetical protein
VLDYRSAQHHTQRTESRGYGVMLFISTLVSILSLVGFLECTFSSGWALLGAFLLASLSITLSASLAAVQLVLETGKHRENRRALWMLILAGIVVSAASLVWGYVRTH